VIRVPAVTLAFMLSFCASAADTAHLIDLSEPAALEELQRTNPAHLDKIRQVIAGLQERPERAEGTWLQVTFAARDVDLSRLLIKTSYPPKQLLKFTIDDSRYIMHVVRNDMVAQMRPAN
jgi:hypothetical protein